MIRVTEDIMATGSGFTTLCEVVVRPADTNKFEIDPYPREEVRTHHRRLLHEHVGKGLS